MSMLKMLMLGIMAAAVLGGAARADSIDTTDKLTIFGRITRMDAKEIVLRADFSRKGKVVTEERRYPRAAVVKIEFDDATFNPGGPPAAGALPLDKNAPPVTRVARDEVELDDGTHKPCDGATIDAQHHLHCGAQEFPENQVLRIFLARTR